MTFEDIPAEVRALLSDEATEFLREMPEAVLTRTMEVLSGSGLDAEAMAGTLNESVRVTQTLNGDTAIPLVLAALLGKAGEYPGAAEYSTALAGGLVAILTGAQGGVYASDAEGGDPFAKLTTSAAVLAASSVAFAVAAAALLQLAFRRGEVDPERFPLDPELTDAEGLPPEAILTPARVVAAFGLNGEDGERDRAGFHRVVEGYAEADRHAMVEHFRRSLASLPETPER